jgi:hypothetical protein
LLGLASIIIGGLALGGIHNYGVTEALKIPQIPIGLIVAGVIVLFLAVVGKIGTFRESKPFLGLFFAILLLITIAELGMGIATYTLADEESLSKEVVRVWPKLSNKVHETVQDNFLCCGLYGSKDTATECRPQGLGTGCLVPFSKWLTNKLQVLDIIAIISAVIQVMILIFTVLLFKAARTHHSSDTVPLLSSQRVIIIK